MVQYRRVTNSNPKDFRNPRFFLEFRLQKRENPGTLDERLVKIYFFYIFFPFMSKVGPNVIWPHLHEPKVGPWPRWPPPAAASAVPPG